MAEFEFARFLQEISTDQPCGENMEYDPLLLEIEQDAEGVPERSLGDAILAAEEADWRAVKSKCLQALAKTRDIQVAVYLTQALLHSKGLSGVSQGLELVQGMLDQFWDCVYPVQDEDDDYPVLRMNTLSTLGDKNAFLDPLRKIPLTDSRVMGRYSLRDIDIAKNHPPGDKKDKDKDDDLPKLSQIDAAFTDTELSLLESNANAAASALLSIEAIITLTRDKVGTVNAPDLTGLVKILQELQQVLIAEVQKRGGTAEGLETAVESDTSTGEPGGIIGSSLKEINSREDVARALDLICEYYALHEPSSPIPLMLKRSQRLLYKDFKEILADLAPDGISQAESIFGVDEDA